MEEYKAVKSDLGEVKLKLSTATEARIGRVHGYLAREAEVHYVALEIPGADIQLPEGVWGPQLLVFRDALALRLNAPDGKQAEVALHGI